MKKLLFFALLLLNSLNIHAQTNVRAWYADGQVFVVWQINLPIEPTYAVYAAQNSFTNTGNALLIGRPFAFEYLGYGLKENLNDTLATFRIPNGQGGLYQLATNEGLFVFTPHQSGSLYFAVTKWGESTVSPGQNITATATSFAYNPVTDPVECHLQKSFPSPFAAGYNCSAFVVWLDGRQNYWNSRPDFPVMANVAKNGMPALFMMSVPIGLDTSIAFPMSVWLHGGGGIARQSLAGSRKEVQINPNDGILVAHDDKMYGYRGTIPPFPDEPTFHFGYAKNYNPFIPNSIPEADTIINYTQRRYLWVDNWIAQKWNIDIHRIQIHGHSMGSAGTLGLVKTYPEHYASATIFNTGCAGPINGVGSDYIYGTREANLPTNLKNRNNEPVRFYDLWDLHTNCSAERDLPLIRHWHGKNDDNGTMMWSPTVVENFNICDSIGTGIQNFWSERPHGMDLAPDYNDHWIQGQPATQQTVVDNVNFAESRYSSQESFPAFFNHRLDPKNNDPGTGILGINNGDGDNWGTWGGYHRWEDVVETTHSWQVKAWLENTAIFDNDNCPENFLTADVAIRRPQLFKPATGQNLYYIVEDWSNGTILQSGSIAVQPDNLVVIPQVNVYKENIRKVRIIITDEVNVTQQAALSESNLFVFPNPTEGIIFIKNEWLSAKISDVNGAIIKQIGNSDRQYDLDMSSLKTGMYFIEVNLPGGAVKSGRFVKL